jgi:hypothetical protein
LLVRSFCARDAAASKLNPESAFEDLLLEPELLLESREGGFEENTGLDPEP